MALEEFSIGGVIALKFRHAAFYSANLEKRELIRKSALSALEAACKPGAEISEQAFLTAISRERSDLSDDQKSLVARICVAASNSYLLWLEDKEEQQIKIKEIRKSRAESEAAQSVTPQTDVAAPAKIPRDLIRYLHGGSGYTGRLSVGHAAPHGSESHRVTDETNMGIQHWVKAVTAGGYGAGHSFAELAGAPQPKYYAPVIPTIDLNTSTREKLLELIDKSTNPGNFVRATLAYYRQPMVINLGNAGDINTANLNNPENTRTMLAMDSIFGRLRNMDADSILTPQRRARFLVMANDILEDVKIKAPRRYQNRYNWQYMEQCRDLVTVTDYIESMMKNACRESGITREDMLKNISADKRAHLREPKFALPVKPEEPGLK